MSNEPPADGVAPGIDLDFFHRVYRTSIILALLGALLIWEPFGAAVVLGWLWGAGLSLLALASLEWSVRRFIRPDVRSARSLVGVMVVKLLGVTVVLALAFIGAREGWISLFGVLAGFMLPHAVVVLKLVGQKVRALSAEGGDPPRR
ncbi:MAG TPA: hypothetical protein VK689_09315 [Armatimonadota bacterium]|nr:hypothetical protein [Armatimonadota bacterium]